jgi:hypothetical protein
VDGVIDVPCAKFIKDLSIPMKTGYDKLPRWSATDENVLKMLQIIQVQHIYVINLQE